MIFYLVACQSNTLVMKIGLFKSCRSAVYLSPFLVDAVRDELLCGHGSDWLLCSRWMRRQQWWAQSLLRWCRWWPNPWRRSYALTLVTGLMTGHGTPACLKDELSGRRSWRRPALSLCISHAALQYPALQLSLEVIIVVDIIPAILYLSFSFLLRLATRPTRVSDESDTSGQSRAPCWHFHSVLF